jgi:hypothetical protein
MKHEPAIASHDFPHGPEAMTPVDTTCGLAKRLQKSLQEHWTRQSTAPWTLIHWDAHAEILLLPAMHGGTFAIAPRGAAALQDSGARGPSAR